MVEELAINAIFLVDVEELIGFTLQKDIKEHRT